MISVLTQNLNNSLSNDYIRTTILVIASVFAGYTLYRVPRPLNNLFYKSWLFKYMILFFGIATGLYPLSNDQMLLALIVPAVVLFIFEMMRAQEGKTLWMRLGLVKSTPADESDTTK